MKFFSPIVWQLMVKTLLWSLTGLTIGVLFFIIFVVFVNGLPQLSWEFLSTNPADMGRSGGILATIVSTLYLIVIALVVATPLGLGTAIYLTEYTREGPGTRIIRFGTECLAGIPSIILGLFGFAIFVMAFGWGWSLVSGGLTLSVMLLPTIIRTSEESILAVPQEYREVSFSLGLGKWQTITRIVLPSALPGIATGIVLSIARSIGETAVIIFTAGSSLRFPENNLRVRPNPGRSFLHSGPGRDFHAHGLRHRGYSHHRYPGHQSQRLLDDALFLKKIFLDGA